MRTRLSKSLGLLKKCYHSKLITTNSSETYIDDDLGIEVQGGYMSNTYDVPYELELNYNPTKEKYFVNNYGEYTRQTMKIVCDIHKYKGVFTEKDLLYLDGATPIGESYNGQNANYEVESVRYYRLNVVIYARRKINKDSLNSDEMV